ncbi:unnamed protein product [Clavelina lepadiformis]|uniref:DNA mismatch repair proteins mutS family domain-containing protein n=1 Tax=Clavelina lepadiformis TaxID=159417 RepID=A0ABP0F1V8_CLALP
MANEKVILPQDATCSDLSSTTYASAKPTDGISKHENSSVFQVPVGPAPRRSSSLVWTPKTPVNAASSSACRTPSSIIQRRSEKTPTFASVRSTPRRKDTPKSRGADTPRSLEASVIVVIVEGRGVASGEIGMASIDLKHPVLILSQFSDSQTYVKTLTRLQLLYPKEIVFPSTMCENGKLDKVFKVVNENFETSHVTSLPRRYFNEANGLEFIKKLAMKENNSIEKDVKCKYYCLAACAALVKYVEFIQNAIYASESLSIVYKGSEQTTLIDSGTCAVLELLCNLEDSKSRITLFGVLNHTKTHGGAKLLRSNIFQPPNHLETIQARLDCVTELANSSELFFGMQSALSRFEIDVDNLLASLVRIPKQNTDRSRENHITTCILLKHVLELVPALQDALVEGQCEIFQAYKATLHDVRFNHILELLETVIHKEARYQKGLLNMKTQRCFAVKSEINGVLDLCRKSYTEYIDDINDLIRQLSEKHDLPLKSSFNGTRGFHIQMPAPKQSSSFPEDFIKVTKTKKTWSFTTNDLMHLNDRVENSLKDINILADSIVCELLSKVRTSIGCLYNLSEIVSTLDMLMSFAYVRTTTDCVRPEFTDTLAVKQAVHPVLTSICSNTIPNNIYASEGSNFNIITGPNMSGKSTYLKEIALLQIMAQMGCYVPAEFASFRIADQIFSRVGSDDDINTNTSSFMMEMKEINYIIQNVSSNSLIIIDELGRGTSSEEAVGLCWAISEFLLSQKAFTFFATHYLELCRMESVYPNVENYQFEVQHVVTAQGSLRKIGFTYVLSRGYTKETHYGLELAQYFDFPPTVLTKAREIVVKLEEEAKEVDEAASNQQKRDNANHRFATKLFQVVRSSRLDDEALTDYLISVRDEYLKEVESLPPDPELVKLAASFRTCPSVSSETDLSDSTATNPLQESSCSSPLDVSINPSDSTDTVDVMPENVLSRQP